MTGRFVHFPGTPGNYLSTPDVNLLDADTAHLEQSRGEWTRQSECVISASPVVDAEAIFGGNVLEVTANASSNAGWFTGDVTSNQKTAVSPSTQYTMTVRVKPGIDRNIRPTFFWLDAAGGFVGQATGPVTPVVVDQWTEFTFTALSHASSVFATVGIQFDSGAAAIGTEKWLVDYAIIREGSDPSFVPSLRIVENLDVEVDADVQDVSAITLVSRQGFAAPLLSWRFYTDGGGGLRFRKSPDGTIDEGIPIGPTLTLGRAVHRALVVGTNGKSFIDGALQSPEATFLNAGFSQISQPFIIGAYNEVGSSEPFTGDIFGVTVRDGDGGPIVARFDPDDIVLP